MFCVRYIPTNNLLVGKKAYLYMSSIYNDVMHIQGPVYDANNIILLFATAYEFW